MKSPTTPKILACLAAAAVLLGGTAAADRLPSPASALTRTVSSAAEAPDRGALSRTDGVSHQAAAVTDAERRAVLDYWTVDRMAAAQPISMAAVDLVEDALQLTERASQAEPQASPHPDSTGEPWTGGGLVTRTTGKVFLTMDGRDFTCSASVVDSANRSTLVTAGHCAKDGRGSWAENWTFVPGYADGASPHGRYTARDLLVAPRWDRDADDSYDFAMAVLNTRDGRAVQDAVGSQRIAFDTWTEDSVRDGVQVYTFGYPAASPFDGRDLHYCSGRTTPDTGGTTANGVGCRMTQGSSGGPWFSGFDTGTGRGTISSVVSFKYSSDTSTQYGPRLGSAARHVFEHAESL